MFSPTPFIQIVQFHLQTGKKITLWTCLARGRRWVSESPFPCAACFPKRFWWPGAIPSGRDEERALLSFLQACSNPNQVSGIPDMSDVSIAQGWKHCSLRDTEACLPQALCSPGWKQLISNCLHSNYLIDQKHCLVFQFSLSHCLPEGLFTALSLIWVGGMPVGEVNCQDRKKHHGSKKLGSLLPHWTDLGSGFCENRSRKGLNISTCIFFVCQKTAILSTRPWLVRVFFPFPWEAF